MTREEARKAAEVMIAYADGKEIEFRYKGGDDESWSKKLCPGFNWDNYDYRVKPETKYRPFKDADEAFAEAKKHGFWVILDNTDYMFISRIKADGFNLAYLEIAYKFKEMLDMKWADDGTPCGIKEEEQP